MKPVIWLLLIILIVCLALSNTTVSGGRDDPTIKKPSILKAYKEYVKVYRLAQLGFEQFGGCKDIYTQRSNPNIKDPAKEYETCNAIERYLLAAYPDFISENALKQLKTELDRKNIDKYDEMVEILKAPLEKIPKKLVLETDIVGNMVKLKFGLFEKQIPKYRFDILSKSGSDEDILELCLNYGRIMASGQHWSIPLETYKKYVAEGATVEGFASALNSQIMRIDKPGLHFCSLMDIDKQFGSLGNFFDQDFAEKFVIVNPPFIEEILERAANKCIEEVRRHKCKFVFYGPNWTDAKFYKLLEVVAKKEILRKGEHEYEDLLHGRIVDAKFESVVFTFGDI